MAQEADFCMNLDPARPMPAGSLGPPSSSSRPGPGPRRQQAPPPRPPAARPSPRVPVPLPPGTAATSARPPEVGTGQPLAPRIPSNRLALARPSAPPPWEHRRWVCTREPVYSAREVEDEALQKPPVRTSPGTLGGSRTSGGGAEAEA
ncbi:basic proline-rich protein [Peromyscus leucopus]|uniref:basic proline-rich protein n=1 Tax=Peromyscus leucopus TaxID=10041 RepID=UPI00188577CF|nr:basic proline-rich protein [Peromyscus leucopus]